MVNMTLAIPEDLSQLIKKHTEVKWSEVARQALWKQARKIELMDKILSNSKLTEEDAMELGAKINLGIARRHGLIK
ncbi:MAG: hypothetical protein KKC75_03150 [Nanoarchaeota archaeon]|nr:hypothetical protein [Nanoarchaeota archaeon]MBU1004790.1 hypothetical protein [Nanoarchaeota archaeon]MBU1945540.1 hypothetical protein [Nanoarchaeota archaeon]